jgi:hypothetical protein
VKLKGESWAGTVIMTVPDSRGMEQEIAFIPWECVPKWMVLIHEGKVAPRLRPKLRHYKAEARDVLARAFLGTPEAPSSGGSGSITGPVV